MWRLANRNTLSRVVSSCLLSNNNLASGNAGARLKRPVGKRLELPNCAEDGEAGAHGLLRIMLMSGGVAEINDHTIAQVLGDKPVKLRRNVGDCFVKGGDAIP